jgi:hypothetical protein
MVSHLAKYRSLMPSLALVFEMVDLGTSPNFAGFNCMRPEALTVSQLNAERAIAWCVFLESHARRIYAINGSREQSAALSLALKLHAGEIGSEGFFTAREVYQKNWTGLQDVKQVKDGAKILADLHWIRPATSESGPEGGRRSDRYEVNPLVAGLDANEVFGCGATQ